MADRYFSETPITSLRAELLDAEAHHLARVLRAKPGDEVVLFDGGGCEFAAKVETIARNRVELSVLERREIDRESPREIVLGVGLPKGDRQRWMVEKLTEIGVSRLVPLETRRGVAKPTENALERLKRAVIEASKQCGRNRLMEIAAPRTWAQFITSAPQEVVRLVAHPDMQHQCTSLGISESVWIAIGPEGGFSEDEVAAALAAGWITIDLGPRILRVETAALVAATRWTCTLAAGGSP